MKEGLMCVLVAVFLVGFVGAAPSVGGVSGAVENSQEIVISGSGFGVNALSDVEWLGDNIESNNAGDIISKSGWSTISDSDSVYAARYSDLEKHSGSKSILTKWGGDPYRYASLFSYNHDSSIYKIYLTWWVKFDYVGTPGQWKMWRLRPDSSVYDTSPEFYQNRWYSSGMIQSFLRPNVDNTDSRWYSTEGDLSVLWSGALDVPQKDEWVRMEYYFETSSQGIRDGTVKYWLHRPGVEIRNPINYDGNLMTHVASQTDRWQYLVFGQYWGNGPELGDSATAYWDDVFIQIGSQARIEIGDSPNWDDCTHREIQVPKTWSSNSITATVNQGTFSNGDTAYLFVVDVDGVASGGYPVTISGDVLTCTNGQIIDCSTGNEGICSVGKRTCLDGSYGSCVQDNQPATEICDNSLDDDCDGSVDEGCDVVTGIVLDDSDSSSSYSGEWLGSTYYPGYYGDGYMYSSDNAGDLFTWTTSLDSGRYEVYVSWRASSGRPSDVEYMVFHEDGQDGVRVDQRVDDVVWNLLGEFDFDGESSVRLNSSASDDGTCADAVRFVRIGDVSSECGDGSCDSGESCLNCEADCGECGDFVSVEFGDADTSDYLGTVEDTYINAGYVGDNFASEVSLNTYTYPDDSSANAIVMRWDVSAIPVSADVINATLYLYMDSMSGDGGDSVYDVPVSRIVDVDAGIGEYTWDFPWGVSGYSDDLGVIEDVSSVDKVFGYKSWSVGDMVSDWVLNSSSNYGMLLDSDWVASSNSNRYFVSSDAVDVGRRPKLVVVYSVGGSCGGADVDDSKNVSLEEVYGYIERWKVGEFNIFEVLNGISDWKNGC